VNSLFALTRGCYFFSISSDVLKASKPFLKSIESWCLSLGMFPVNSVQKNLIERFENLRLRLKKIETS